MIIVLMYLEVIATTRYTGYSYSVTCVTSLIMSGIKRKKSTAGAAIEDDLPDHLRYHGNAPKQNAEFPEVFSTPVIPFISRQWSYAHWIHRADD